MDKHYVLKEFALRHSQESGIYIENLITLASTKTELYISLFKIEIDYLILIKIRAPLNFAPLIFAHPQILRPFNFRAPLFYCKFAVFSFIRGIFSSPFNFRAFILRELAPLNFRAG